MNFYTFLNIIRKLYWFLVRPKTTGVKCLIQNEQGEYLLIKTTYSGDYWTIPGGGKNRNESLEEAAQREVKEEVGITITELLYLDSYVSELEYKKDTVRLYAAKTNQADISINAREISEAKWFAKDAIPENTSGALTVILSKL